MVGVTEALSHPCSRAVKRLFELAAMWPADLGAAEPQRAAACRTARQVRDEVVDELVRGWVSGLSVAELATRFQVHRATVGKYLGLRGIDTANKLRLADLARAAELYEHGWTLVQLGVEFKTTKKTIRKRLGEAGVQMRRSGRLSAS